MHLKQVPLTMIVVTSWNFDGLTWQLVCEALARRLTFSCWIKETDKDRALRSSSFG